MELGPFLVTPRLDAKPWGGGRLGELGYAVEGPEPLGEVVMTATANVVADGPHAGLPMSELIVADPLGMIGRRGLAATGGRLLFPLLAKLIDAAEPLSIQVHPDDARAERAGSLGKTEAWHILAAEPGAVNYVGLVDGAGIAELEQAAADGPGMTARFVRQVPALSGESLLFPAGTLHALGAGVMVYEIQQPSEITYRLDDWGRVGADGRPRAMHVAESLETIESRLRPELIAPVRLDEGGVARDLLAACRYFALDRLRLPAGGSVTLSAGDTAQVVTVTRGVVEVGAAESADGVIRVRAGQTIVVPAVTASIAARSEEGAELLRAWVPDLAADVVAPARARGVGREALAALAGPLDDVARAMDGG